MCLLQIYNLVIKFHYLTILPNFQNTSRWQISLGIVSILDKQKKSTQNSINPCKRQNVATRTKHCKVNNIHTHSAKYWQPEWNEDPTKTDTKQLLLFSVITVQVCSRDISVYCNGFVAAPLRTFRFFRYSVA